MLSPLQFLRSLHYAARGVTRVWREEQNFRLQVAAGIAVVILMFLLGVSSVEKSVLTLAIALVLVLELLNSALERVVDMLKPRLHHYVEEIKDVSAAMVLLAAIASAVIGVTVFWPYLSALASFR